jgi:hypothetical protein
MAAIMRSLGPMGVPKPNMKIAKWREGCQGRSRVGGLAGAGSGEGPGYKSLCRNILRHGQRADSFSDPSREAGEGCQTQLATLAINFPLE